MRCLWQRERCWLESMVGPCANHSEGPGSKVTPCQLQTNILVMGSSWLLLVLSGNWTFEMGTWSAHYELGIMIHQAITLDIHSSNPPSNGNSMYDWTWAGPERVQSSCTKRLPKCLWFLLPLQYLLDPSIDQFALWGMLYGELTKKKKTRAFFFTDGSTHYAGTMQKWTAVALQPLSRITVKDLSGEKSSVGRISSNEHCWTFFLEREMARCVTVYWFIGYR